MSAIQTTGGMGDLQAAGFDRGVRLDTDGFARFAREHERGLVQFLLNHTATRQDAEDIAQESLVRLMRYRYSAPASDWPRLLYRIALNAARDRFRAARRQRAVLEVVRSEPASAVRSCAPDDYAAREQVLARIRATILGLPPKCRRVCALKLARGLTNAEIASLCGISSKMVEKHLAKGLARVRAKVGSWGPRTFIR